MEKILEKLLHIEVIKKDFQDMDKLPLYLKGGYQIWLIDLAGQEVLFISPKEQSAFPTLRKHWKQFVKLTGFPCVIYLERYTQYGIKRMIELGISYVIGEENVYLPFLGIALTKKKQAELPDIEKFSPFTQRLVLTALYENWDKYATKEVAEKLNVSKMTVTRSLLELEALELPLVQTEGKTKYFHCSLKKEELYEQYKPYFINPISKVYRLEVIPDKLEYRFGGMSAICHYSMLGDDTYPVFAITRNEAKELDICNYRTVPRQDTPACVVQVLRYLIDKKESIDPISAVLSLSETDLEEPRVESAVEEILEEVFRD